MKPPKFRYLRPDSLEEVLAALAEHGDEAKPLAGGQSLIPAMNFRLAQPSILVDLELVSALQTLAVDDGALRIGAMVRQRVAERSGDVRSACPLLAEALPWIGHIQNRNRGTIGGSIAHADPAAELPAVAVALDATIELASSRGSRSVPAATFFEGPFTTAVEADEIITGVRFPVAEGGRASCLEVAPRHGDFAVVGVAASVRFAAGGTMVEDVGLAAFGVGAAPIRLSAAEAQVRGVELTPDVAEQAGAASTADVADPTSDIHATSDYRRLALTELVKRALRF
ncbi:MAG TPA: xanthine dehydrogenase family protein subunit M [Ilumatobacter sp.]